MTDTLHRAATVAASILFTIATAYGAHQGTAEDIAALHTGMVSQGAVVNTIDIEVCDIDCMNDFAEAVQVVLDYYKDEKQKAYAKREKKPKEQPNPFDIDPVRDGERLLMRPAYIRAAPDLPDYTLIYS